MGGARAGLALALLAALACGRSQEKPPVKQAAERAPNFELKDLSGKTVRLSDFQGKVVLLDFWATYCVPCHESIPVFQRLYEKYRGQGVEVVGVSIDAFTEHVAGFVKEQKMGYTVVLDPESSAPPLFGVRGLPTTLLVDRSGAIRQRWVGFDPEVASEIQAGIEAALKSS